MCTPAPISPHPSQPSYLPQVSCVSDGSRVQFVQKQRDSLKWADPGSLRDPLSCTDPITQTRNCTGAQTHLHTQHRTDIKYNLFMSLLSSILTMLLCLSISILCHFIFLLLDILKANIVPFTLFV